MAGMPPILIELKALTSEFKSSMVESKAQMADLEESGSKNMSGLQKTAQAAGVGIGIAFVGAAALSIKAGMDYQSTMATIGGAAGLTTSQVKSLGDSFTDTMGKSTFSAQSMATAMAPVAGVVKQLSGGTLTAASSMQFMKAAMDESEATGTSLTSTTKDLSNVMLTYGISTKGAGDASNTLFNISRATGVGLDTLASTVDKLHAKLGAASPSLTDTGTLMVDLAEHGVTGSRGVMAVTSGLTTLLGGSKATDAELSKLGVSVYNSSGQFVGMSSVIAQLQPKLSGMSDQQRTAAESTLFGATAANTLNGTLMAGVGAWNTASAAVAKKDAVDAAAAAQSATLKGEIEKVAATAEDLAVKFGEVLIPILQKAIGVVSDIVTWFTKHKDAAIALGVVIAGALTAAIAVWAAGVVKAQVQTVTAFAKMVGGWVGIGSAAEEGGAESGEAATAMSETITATMSDVLVVLQEIRDSLLGLGPAAEEATAAVSAAEDVLVADSEAAGVAVDTAMGPIGLAIAGIGVAVALFATHWKAIWNGIGDALKTVWNDVLKPVVNFFEQNWKTALEVAVAIVAPFIGLPLLLITHWQSVVSFFTGLWNDIVSGVKAMLGFVEGVFTGLLSFIEGIPGDLASAGAQMWTWFLDLLNDAWAGVQSVWNDVTGFVTGIPGKFAALGAQIWTWFLDLLNTEWAGVKIIWTDVTGFVTSLPGKFAQLGKDIWKWFGDFLTAEWTGVQAIWGHVVSFVGGIPDKLKSGASKIWTWFSDDLSTAWTWITGEFATVVTFVGGLPAKIKSAAAGMWDGIKDAFKSAINWVIGAWDSLHFTIHIPSVNFGLFHLGGGDISFGVPQIPQIATGGMTTGLMAAVIGDNPSGQEVVLPMDSPNTISTLALALKQASQMAQSSSPVSPGLAMSMSGASGSSSGGSQAGTVVAPTYNFNITGADVSDPHAITTQVQNAINANNADLVRRITAAGGRR